VKYMGRDVSFNEAPQQQTFIQPYYGERFLPRRMMEGERYGGGYGGGGYGGGGYGGGGYGGGGAGYAGVEESGFEGDLTPEGKAAANAIRGYIVTIRGTTPNKGKSNFIDSAFVQKLLEHTAEHQLKLGKSWYVARAEIVQVGPRNLKNQPQYDEGGDENAELNGEIVVQVDKNGKAIFNPKADRIFPDEVITADTEFVVLAIIALDPANAPQDPNKKPATP